MTDAGKYQQCSWTWGSPIECAYLHTSSLSYWWKNRAIRHSSWACWPLSRQLCSMASFRTEIHQRTHPRKVLHFTRPPWFEHGSKRCLGIKLIHHGIINNFLEPQAAFCLNAFQRETLQCPIIERMIHTHYALDYLQALELNSIQRQNIRNEVVCYCIRDKRITTKEAYCIKLYQWGITRHHYKWYHATSCSCSAASGCTACSSVSGCTSSYWWCMVSMGPREVNDQERRREKKRNCLRFMFTHVDCFLTNDSNVVLPLYRQQHTLILKNVYIKRIRRRQICI